MDGLRACIVVVTLVAACAAGPQTPALHQRPYGSAVPGTAAVDTIWLFFLDDLHLAFRDTGRIREFLAALATGIVGDGDLCLVASSGPSNIRLGPTSNRMLLASAFRRGSGAALGVRDIAGTVTLQPMHNEVNVRAGIALASARGMLATVHDTHSRRKALLYVSRGYGFDPPAPDDTPTGAPHAGDDTITTTTELRRSFNALVQQARSARVAIFTIDPPGVENVDPPVDPVWDHYVVLTERNRRALSDQTGGVALLGVRDPREVVRRIQDALALRRQKGAASFSGKEAAPFCSEIPAPCPL